MKIEKTYTIQIGQPDRVTIVLAGCGGTGSFLALHLGAVFDPFLEKHAGNEKRLDGIMRAERIRALLSSITSVQDDSAVPSTSLLREFIAPIFRHGHEMAEGRALAAGWRKDEVPLLVLAMFHVVVGFFTTAPLYKALNGTDLLDEQAVARQTRFLLELSERLFTPPQRDR